MTRLTAVVQLAPDAPTIGLVRASVSGYVIEPFAPRPLRPGKPWARAEWDRARLRRPDADETLSRMGYVAVGTWEPGERGQWSAEVVPTFSSLPALAAATREPVTVSLNVARLLAGQFRPPAPAAELVGTRAVEAVSGFVAELAMFAEMWTDEARYAARRVYPVLEVAPNVQAQPWDPPAVSLPNTLPDDGPLAWHVWTEATRLTPAPEIPAFLR